MQSPPSRLHQRARTFTTLIFSVCGIFIVNGVIRAFNGTGRKDSTYLHMHLPHLSFLGSVNETQQQLQAQVAELQTLTKQHSAQASQLAEHLTKLHHLEEQVDKLQTQVNQQGSQVVQSSKAQEQLSQQHEQLKLKLGAAQQQEDPCALAHVMPRKELWGAVVVAGRTADGSGGLKAASAQECCRACHNTPSCNQWVWCWNSKLCGQECWLKREGDASKISAGPEGPDVRWTSGYFQRGFNVDPATLPPLDTRINTVVLKTQYGKIRIQLKPEWSQSSVEYVRRLAQNPELCNSQCRFYRAEPGFLLQGTLESATSPNKQTQPGPKIMEKGEIGWAGGGAGPHWFIYVGEQPAQHFGTSHTVWGQLADKPSMDVVQDILALPSAAAKPGDMRYLNESVWFVPMAELA